jgi:hypothetical protein
VKEVVRLAAVLGDYYHSYEWAKQTLETAVFLFDGDCLNIGTCKKLTQ